MVGCTAVRFDGVMGSMGGRERWDLIALVDDGEGMAKEMSEAGMKIRT